MFDFYTEFTQEKFIDEYEDEERKDSNRLYGIESAHYTINFLFDLLQFTFQFMIMAEEINNTNDKMEIDTQDETTQWQRKIFDHRKPLVGKEDLISIKYKFYFEGFD